MRLDQLFSSSCSKTQALDSFIQTHSSGCDLFKMRLPFIHGGQLFNGIVDFLVMITLHALVSTMSVIQLEKVVQALSLTGAEVINDTTGTLESIHSASLHDGCHNDRKAS